MEHMQNFHEILKGATRALFVSCWADHEEEEDRSYSGMELTEVAPDNSIDALIEAAGLLGQIKLLNKSHVSVLYARALEANAKEPEACYKNRDTPYEFGFMLAMTSMGHGVAWSDNNANIDIELPYFECEWFNVEPTPDIDEKLQLQR
jgi:hypothetical protein